MVEEKQVRLAMKLHTLLDTNYEHIVKLGVQNERI